MVSDLFMITGHMDSIDAACAAFISIVTSCIQKATKTYISPNVGRGEEGADAVCFVQWITSLIVPLEGQAKKKKKKKRGMEKTQQTNKPTSLNYLK